jgi:hypothetical protein
LLDEAVRVILAHSGDVDALFGEQVLAGESLDVQKAYSSFTMDSFVEIAFGRKQSTLKSTTPFSTSFDAATRLLIMRLIVPFRRWLPTPALSRHIRTVHDFADDVIAERKREFAASVSIENREDVLSRFIALGESDNEFLRDAVVNFILAGRDTTAQTLSWLSYLLASNQTAQDKMAAEVAALSEITVDSLKTLTYTQACMDETLRLYPPVPIDIKQSVGRRPAAERRAHAARHHHCLERLRNGPQHTDVEGSAEIHARALDRERRQHGDRQWRRAVPVSGRTARLPRHEFRLPRSQDADGESVTQVQVCARPREAAAGRCRWRDDVGARRCVSQDGASLSGGAYARQHLCQALSNQFDARQN